MGATVHNLGEARQGQRKPAQVDWSEPLVTRHQLADHLGFSPRWVSGKVAEGLPHFRMGGSLRFQVSVAAQWLLDQETTP
jgi:hypothetical protein